MLLQNCGLIIYIVAELWVYLLCCDRTVGLFLILWQNCGLIIYVVAELCAYFLCCIITVCLSLML